MAKSKNKIYFWTLFFIFLMLGIYFLLIYIFPNIILTEMNKSLNFLSWIFTFFLGGIIPGIIYGGGEGYSKLKKGKFVIKEKGFLYRLLDFFIMAMIVLIAGFFFSWVFTMISKYVLLVFVEIILLAYIAYCRDHKFNFPWVYFIGITLINLLWGYFIFRFI